MRSSKLLIPSHPLQVIPELAVIIGLADALVLQQIHYWLLKYGNDHHNRKWIYNTLDEWQTQFPFWSKKTIQRTLKRLVDRKLVRVGKFNKKNWDRTNWYSINYEALAKLEEQSEKIFEECKKTRVRIATERRRRHGHSVYNVKTE